MFKNENIHPSVQKALYRKIDSLNRLRLGTDSPFFNGGVLEPQDNSNPVEQHLYRNCFAKVSAAIKSETQDELLDQPESLSSYFTIGENRTSQTNKPLTFRKSFEETPDNIFRGHTGITSIEASQLSFFTKKYTINFSCPDPIDFESRVQPTFLRHGQFIAIEFGWGIEEDSINIPPLSNKDLQDLVDGVRERNLQAAGNYICDVGIVTNYDFKLESTGGYTGTIDVVTQGQNILNQTTEEAETKSGETLSEIIADIKEIAKNEEQDFDSDGEKEKQFSVVEQTKAENQLDRLKIKSVTYQSAMRNLDKVLDSYFGDKKVKVAGVYGTQYSQYYKRKEVKKYKYLDNYKIDGRLQRINQLSAGRIEYFFKNGAMYLNQTNKGYLTGPSIPDSLKKRYFMSWGWFEDHILNSFFRTTAKGKVIQEIRSITGVKGKETPTKCHISKDLFSLGLDSVILPGKHQPKIRQDLQMEQLPKFRTREKVKLARMRNVFEIIDENFNSFVPFFDDTLGEDPTGKRTFVSDEGEIRNMVFPMEFYQKHFQNISTVRQGMQSFWAEVSNLYGGFWNFQVVEDNDVKGRIGIVDFLIEEKNEIEDPSILANQSDRTTFKDYNFRPGEVDKQYQKMFTFPLYSKDGIVKDFSLSIKLTSKAAVLVNYGTNTNILNSVGSGDGKDLGLIAYTYLLKKHRQEVSKPDTDNSNPINKSDAVLQDLSFEITKNGGVGVGTSATFYNERTRGQGLVIEGDTEETINESEFAEFGELDSRFGIDFKSIKDIKDDKDEITNRIQSRRALKENGIGMYDENGNLTPEMRQYMNYIINYSLHEGDDSNIQRTKPVIPIELSMTLDGIGGLKPGDMFRVDYLPKVYRDFAYFQIFQVNHSMGTSGWETKITAQMKLDLVKMKKEGYVQTTEPRDFDLGDITEAMRIFYDDDNAAIVFNNTLSQQDQAWNAIIQSQIDKGYKMVGLIPLQALLIDDGMI